MPTHKRLKSVTQSIAHHAVSGLSFVHPYLGVALQKIGKNSTEIDLLAEDSCPENFARIGAVSASLCGLKKTFEDLLNTEGFNLDHISSATLTFYFDFDHFDSSCSICRCDLISKEGRNYSYTVDFRGKTQKN